MTLEELFAGRPVDIPKMLTRLRQVAAEEGLPFGDRKKTFNSRMAQELGKWAESKGEGERFHNAMFRAYFADGLNIGRVQVLLDVCKSMGLPLEEAEKVLEGRPFRDAVDQDWARSREAGITAVPTFSMNRQMLVGAQPYEALEKLVSGRGGGLL